jgi:hypothetical protein
MKFARSLQESEQPELHALYKQVRRRSDPPLVDSLLALPPSLYAPA